MELNVRATRLGSKIVELQSVGKSFGGKRLIHNFLYTFRKGDRIGIVGQNGMGKSTLLNMITGELRPDNGQVVTGDTVQFGYYKQTELEFREDQRVIDIVKDVAEVVRLGTGQTVTVSQFLQTFLFSPAKQYDYVSKLSGGEKRRLQLLLMLMKEPNFLILDEPTNDLDISSLNVLEEFLVNFPGCLMIVSHDRYFLDRLVDHVFVFEGDGEIRDFPGNYTDLREWQQEEAQQQKKKQQSATPPVTEKKEATGLSLEKRKLSFKETKELETLVKEIEALERRKSALLDTMNAGGSHSELTVWAREIEQITEVLNDKEMRWLELSEFA